MKKIFIVLGLLISSLTFGQVPAKHSNGVRMGVMTSEPAGGVESQIYYNGNENIYYYHNGSGFVPMTNTSDLYTGNAILEGSFYWLQDYDYYAEVSDYIIAGVRYQNVVIANPVTLTAAHATLDRFDVLVVNDVGTITAIAGVPAADPTIPDIDEDTQVLLGIILVTANTTAPIGILNELVYDENLQVVGGEWDTSSGANVTLDSSAEAESGSVSIFFNNASRGNYARFVNDVSFDGTQLSNLVFKIKLDNNPGQGQSIRMILYNSASPFFNTIVNMVDGDFGLDTSDLTNWQTIIIPGNVLGVSGSQYDTFEISNRRNGASFHIDNIITQEGTIPTAVVGDLQAVTDIGSVTTNNITLDGGSMIINELGSNSTPSYDSGLYVNKSYSESGVKVGSEFLVDKTDGAVGDYTYSGKFGLNHNSTTNTNLASGIYNKTEITGSGEANELIGFYNIVENETTGTNDPFIQYGIINNSLVKNTGGGTPTMDNVAGIISKTTIDNVNASVADGYGISTNFDLQTGTVDEAASLQVLGNQSGGSINGFNYIQIKDGGTPVTGNNWTYAINSEVAAPSFFSGDIEFKSDDFGTRSLFAGQLSIDFNTDEPWLYLHNNNTSYLNLEETFATMAITGGNATVFSLGSSLGARLDAPATSRGLYSNTYYGANYDDNTYVQKKYVDDNLLDLTRYVQGWEDEKLMHNLITVGKGVGKLRLTNGSSAIVGIDGVDFTNETNFDSPFYYYEATVVLPDGSYRYLQLDSASDSTNGIILDINQDIGYGTSLGANWLEATGDYEYYPYFISKGTNSELSIISGYNTVADEIINSLVIGSSHDIDGGYNSVIAGNNKDLNAVGSSFIGGLGFKNTSNVLHSLILTNSVIAETDDNFNGTIIVGSNHTFPNVNDNIVDSFIFGQSHEIKEQHVFSFGSSNILEGVNSTAIGIGLNSPSYAEISLGHYNTDYVANSTSTINTTDRLFSIGNGTNIVASDALNVWKDGTIDIPSYGSGTNTGTATYSLAVDASGNVIEEGLAQTLNLGTDGQIPYMNGTIDFTYSNRLRFTGSFLDLGEFNTVAGGLRLYGSSSNAGGNIQVYTGDNVNTNTQFYQIGTNSTEDFSIRSSSNRDVFTYDHSEDDVILGDTNSGIKASSYGSGTNTGTATYNLAVDVNGNIIEESLSTGIGGSISDNQVAFGASTAGEIEGNNNFTHNGTGAVAIGNADTVKGGLNLYGSNIIGGALYIYNSGSSDTVEDRYSVYTNSGDFVITADTGGDFLYYDDSSQDLTLGGTQELIIDGSDVHLKTDTANAAFYVSTVDETDGGYLEAAGFGIYSDNKAIDMNVGSNPEIIFTGTNSNSIDLQAPTTPQAAFTINIPDKVADTYELALVKKVLDDTSTSLTLDLDDANEIVTLNNASAVSLTIPANSSVAFPIGTEIVLINKGAGTVTISITTDTLNHNIGGLTMAQYDKRTLTKITATSWILGY